MGKKNGLTQWEKYISDAVNDFDKEFKGDKKTEPERLFNDTVDKFEDFLRVIVYELNGATSDEYLTKKKKKVKIIDSEKMMEESHLCWYHPEYNIGVDSMIFKGRYLSLFLSYIMHNVGDMAINQHMTLSSADSGYYENSYLYLTQIIKDIKRFIAVLLSNSEYPNIILQVFQDCAYLQNKFYAPTLNRQVRDIVENLREGLYCKYGIYPMQMPEDIAIDSVLKLTYMLVTGDPDVKSAIPKFKHIEGARAKNELRGLIEALGKSIDKIKYKKRNVMYLSFTQSDPLIMSKYKDVNENVYISNGVRGLEYVKFFCNNRDISRFINKMLR